MATKRMAICEKVGCSWDLSTIQTIISFQNTMVEMTVCVKPQRDPCSPLTARWGTGTLTSGPYPESKFKMKDLWDCEQKVNQQREIPAFYTSNRPFRKGIGQSRVWGLSSIKDIEDSWLNTVPLCWLFPGTDRVLYWWKSQATGEGLSQSTQNLPPSLPFKQAMQNEGTNSKEFHSEALLVTSLLSEGELPSQEILP